jgi:site-specific recombinase XerD
LSDTGSRISELANIKLEDIDSERGWIKVKGKGAKGRVVRIGSTAQRPLLLGSKQNAILSTGYKKAQASLELGSLRPSLASS